MGMTIPVIRADGNQPDQQRKACAEHHAAEDITTAKVGPKVMRGGRRSERVRPEVDRIKGRKQGSADRAEDEHQENREPDSGAPTALDAPNKIACR